MKNKMQIFSREVHLLTRGSAALASCYLIYSYFYGYQDPWILIIGVVMLLFDSYTFYHTLRF